MTILILMLIIEINMIKYNLKCNNNHEFESWFSNSKMKKYKFIENANIVPQKNKQIYNGSNDLSSSKKKYKIKN